MEFQDYRSTARDAALESADVLEAMFPDFFTDLAMRQLLFFQYFRMHAHDQHFFIMRAVENSDVPALRQRFVDPPEKIVLQFLGAWRLERMHVATFRIDAGHHMLDNAVLAGGIHALQ